MSHNSAANDKSKLDSISVESDVLRLNSNKLVAEKVKVRLELEEIEPLVAIQRRSSQVLGMGKNSGSQLNYQVDFCQHKYKTPRLE